MVYSAGNLERGQQELDNIHRDRFASMKAAVESHLIRQQFYKEASLFQLLLL